VEIPLHGASHFGRFVVQSKTYSDRYDDASATWVVICAILMFFMVSKLQFLEFVNGFD